jgi:spermidine synthase
MWFIDKNSPFHWIYHRVKRNVVSVKTLFQHVEIFDTYEYGRMVVLDGQIQSAESDEFIYHEILVHPAMIAHPRPEHILILGAGEGATLREVLKHPTVRRVTMIDIDRKFVELCRRYLRKWHRGSFRNRKVELVHDDAFEYLRKSPGSFDVIIADISDPADSGPSQSIYTTKFYSLVRKVLKKDGIFVTHATAVYYFPHRNYSAGIMKKLSRIFANVDAYYEYIPSYGTLWSYATGSFRYSPKALSKNVIEQRLKVRGIANLSYYSPETHKRLFTMPPCLQESVPVDQSPL